MRPSERIAEIMAKSVASQGLDVEELSGKQLMNFMTQSTIDYLDEIYDQRNPHKAKDAPKIVLASSNGKLSS